MLNKRLDQPADDAILPHKPHTAYATSLLPQPTKTTTANSPPPVTYIEPLPAHLKISPDFITYTAQEASPAVGGMAAPRLKVARLQEQGRSTTAAAGAAMVCVNALMQQIYDLSTRTNHPPPQPPHLPTLGAHHRLDPRAHRKPHRRAHHQPARAHAKRAGDYPDLFARGKSRAALAVFVEALAQGAPQARAALGGCVCMGRWGFRFCW